MSVLRATVIDVGWGDSILLESERSDGRTTYALIDSNDSVSNRSSHTFLKRFFERNGLTIPVRGQHVFEWVLLTHPHADHAQGLKRIFRDFGALQFWYPQSSTTAVFFSNLIRFATRSPKVRHYQVVHSSLGFPRFGDAHMEVLWPPPSVVSANENDNSVVIALTLGTVTFVLTGDAEADGVWTQIATRLPVTTQFFKVPHHGARNGTFDSGNQTPWLSVLPKDAVVGISSHVRPFSHPDPDVLNALNQKGVTTYRTDSQYHLTFETDGATTKVRYSHE